MGLTQLLTKEHAPLERLALSRIQLDTSFPSMALHTHGKEGLLYGLVGLFNVYANGLYLGSYDAGISIESHRGTDIMACRFPAHNEYDISITMRSHAADLLWVTCTPYPLITTAHVAPIAPYIHVCDSVWHDVGHGTHQRTVCELPTPPGYEIATGETHNIPGGWSSFPSHATQEDIERFGNKETTWEETMFFVCKQPAIVSMKGVYTDGLVVNKVMEVFNGEAHAMPLGNHFIVSHPSSTCFYWWGYVGNALQKTYNKFAEDLQTYRK